MFVSEEHLCRHVMLAAQHRRAHAVDAIDDASGRAMHDDRRQRPAVARQLPDVVVVEQQSCSPGYHELDNIGRDR
jgi:hypothetical protein